MCAVSLIDIYYEPKEITAIVKTTSAFQDIDKGSDISKVASPSNAPPGYGYLLTYNAFIPLNDAVNPFCAALAVTCINGNYKFHGDGRGFSVWDQDDKFRVRSTVWLTKTHSGKKYIKQRREIGETIGYDMFGRVNDRDTAPISDIQLTYKNTTSSNWYHRVEIASNNPLAPLSPDINVEYYSRVNVNGSGYHKVVHDRAPSHEMYLHNYPGDDYYVLYRHSHEGFRFLYPVSRKEKEIYNDPFF
ncbi:hypothetical protein LC087_12680 [Bacillus carboniphilus]|uniref:Uncharacterized protein n=1 Tax=Bacillus carboniphilus TaxID=86663 RepID=A0ABY9JSC8_9BACI|nr:hypothetical protein [Bacillus carboniphilus]WLR41714.1 hypothetical protein LC087_12680 [Bacillus carboniphilus]